MKKNKKYWKNEAKHWKEIARTESESADYWCREAVSAEKQRDMFKNELNVLRQYNIGKKPYGTATTGTTGTNTNYQVWSNANSIEKWAKDFMQKHNIPVGVDEATKRVIAESATLGKRCNCKCNRNK